MAFKSPTRVPLTLGMPETATITAFESRFLAIFVLKLAPSCPEQIHQVQPSPQHRLRMRWGTRFFVPQAPQGCLVTIYMQKYRGETSKVVCFRLSTCSEFLVDFLPIFQSCQGGLWDVGICVI